MTKRMFPIQAESVGGLRSEIPWWLAEEAYAQYASKYGTDQSLERLAERGGFGRDELLDLLAGGNGNGETLQQTRSKRRK